MVMDLRRAAVVEWMQFDQAGLWFAPVRWYVAPDGALAMPGPHLFGANIWQDQGRINLDPGVYWNQTPSWSNGALPGPFAGQGPPCGPREWWENGVPSDAPPLQLDDRGFPNCCHVPLIHPAEIGVKIGLARLLCQPWHVIGPPARSFVRLATGTVWNVTLNLVANFAARSPVFVNDTVGMSSGGPATGCHGFNSTTAPLMRVQTPFPVQQFSLRFQNWDPATSTGYWRVPATASRYANELFAFRNPV